MNLIGVQECMLVRPLELPLLQIAFLQALIKEYHQHLYILVHQVEEVDFHLEAGGGGFSGGGGRRPAEAAAGRIGRLATKQLPNE